MFVYSHGFHISHGYIHYLVQSVLDMVMAACHDFCYGYSISSVTVNTNFCSAQRSPKLSVLLVKKEYTTSEENTAT